MKNFIFGFKSNSQNPAKLKRIILEKSAWKSVYIISEFTVGMETAYLQQQID